MIVVRFLYLSAGFHCWLIDWNLFVYLLWLVKLDTSLLFSVINTDVFDDLFCSFPLLFNTSFSFSYSA